MIGERLREAREMRGLSLMDVASKAHVSAATLSRIENSKQGLDFGLFLNLAKILLVEAADLLDSESGSNHDALAGRIVQLSTTERVRLWRELAEARRISRLKHQARRSETISQQMDELFAQFEFIREGLEAVRSSVRRRPNVPRLTSASE